ncbi:MAG: DUF4249 family protein [Bacteroidales bacterium]|nr:DUF4249 family protein [Bacteroidales bacterium]
MGTYHIMTATQRQAKFSRFLSLAAAFCIFIAGILLLCFCTRETDLKPEGRGTPVVECVLSQDAVQTLRLTLTDIASDEDRNTLENATVLLTDTDNGEVMRFKYDGASLWTLDYSAKPNHRYLLEIDVDGRDKVSAETRMPEELAIKYTVMTHATPDAMMLNFDEDDDHSEHFEGFPDFEQGIRYVIKSLPSGAVWVCGRSYDKSSDTFSFAQEIATSLENADPFNLSGEEYWNPFNQKADSWYQEHYDDDTIYPGGRSSLYHYPKQFRPTMYKYIVGRAIHDRFLRIPSLEEDDNRTAADPEGYFSIAGSFTPDYDFWTFDENAMPINMASSWTPGDSYLLFSSLSPEYDRYLKECLIEKAAMESVSDFASLFSRKNTYGNIKNGIGIFGARTDQKLPWNKYTHNGLYSPDWY